MAKRRKCAISTSGIIVRSIALFSCAFPWCKYEGQYSEQPCVAKKGLSMVSLARVHCQLAPYLWQNRVIQIQFKPPCLRRRRRQRRSRRP